MVLKSICLRCIFCKMQCWWMPSKPSVCCIQSTTMGCRNDSVIGQHGTLSLVFIIFSLERKDTSTKQMEQHNELVPFLLHLFLTLERLLDYGKVCQLRGCFLPSRILEILRSSALAPYVCEGEDISQILSFVQYKLYLFFGFWQPILEEDWENLKGCLSYSMRSLLAELPLVLGSRTAFIGIALDFNHDIVEGDMTDIRCTFFF